MIGNKEAELFAKAYVDDLALKNFVFHYNTSGIV